MCRGGIKCFARWLGKQGAKLCYDSNANVYEMPGLWLQVQCTATSAFGVMTDSTLTTTSAGGQAVTDFPGGGGTSGTPDIVTVLCTATPADEVCLTNHRRCSSWQLLGAWN
jgi:hypothetical protein